MSRKRKPVLIPATGYVDVWRHRETGKLRVKIYRSHGHFDAMAPISDGEFLIATCTSPLSADELPWYFFNEEGGLASCPPKPQALLAIAALNAEILEQNA